MVVSEWKYTYYTCVYLRRKAQCVYKENHRLVWLAWINSMPTACPIISTDSWNLCIVHYKTSTQIKYMLCMVHWLFTESRSWKRSHPPFEFALLLTRARARAPSHTQHTQHTQTHSHSRDTEQIQQYYPSVLCKHMKWGDPDNKTNTAPLTARLLGKLRDPGSAVHIECFVR